MGTFYWWSLLKPGFNVNVRIWAKVKVSGRLLVVLVRVSNTQVSHPHPKLALHVSIYYIEYVYNNKSNAVNASTTQTTLLAT